MSVQDVGRVIVSVDGLGLFVQQPDTTDFYLNYDSPFGGTIGQLNISCGIGNGVVTLLINTTPVDGIENVPVDQNRAQYTATGHNKFSVGDDVILRIVTASNLLNLKANVAINKTTL